MINTLIFIVVSAICGFGIGVFVSFRKKKKFKENEPDYEALYIEATKRLKTSITENNNQYSTQGNMTEQMLWHKNLLEHIVIKYEIKDDELYELVKATNDSMGLSTPTQEEMERSVEQVLRMLGDEEQLKAYQNSKKDKQSTKSINLDLNTILDKVSKMGMDSLTEEEREFLNKQ